MQNHHQQVERTAWTVIILSFVAFCGLLLLALYGGKWYLFDSDISQEATLTLISGNVTFTQPGDSQRLVVGAQPIDNLAEGAQIESEAGAQAAVEFHASDKTTLGGMQLYSNSRATLTLLRSPRFGWSNRPYRIVIALQRGRARVNLTPGDLQSVNITLQTRHSAVVLARLGSYSVEVTDKGTEVSVREGVVTVSASGQSLTLAPNERTFIPDGGPPQGILVGETNLIRDGDFAQGLLPDWASFQDLKDPKDALGEITTQTDEENNYVVSFFRPGVDWGRVGIRQTINRDIRDYKVMRLHLKVRLVSQNVTVCGTYGSECPVMIKIEYTDRAGGQREWIQGFYYLSDARQPQVCVTCQTPQSPHVLVRRDSWYFYESPELISLLNNPAIINAVSIYGEGHTFESFVSEVELLAGD
jgi:hypothetical protein